MKSTSSASLLGTTKPLTVQERLILQQIIGNNEPIDQQSVIGAHNAYNTASDGYLLPNQQLGTPSLLDAGARALELDLAFDGFIHMRHAGWKMLEGRGNYTKTIGDIKTWLESHPQDVLILQYQDNDIKNAADLVMNPLREQLGDRFFTPDHYLQNRRQWPSRNEMLAKGWQIVLLTQNNPLHYHQPNQPDLAFHGDWGGVFKEDYDATGRISVFDPTCSRVLEKKIHSFSEVGEDRSLIGYGLGAVQDTLNSVIDVYNAAKKSIGFPPTSPFRLVAGQITEQSMQKLVDCNVNIIALDMMSVDDRRLEKALWSWDNHAPQPLRSDKSCISLNMNTRWTNEADCDTALAIVCMDQRGNWITTDKGRWEDATKICADKEMQFAAPVNGYEQHQLHQQAGGAVHWINAELTRHSDETISLYVNDRLAGDATRIGVLPPVQPPNTPQSLAPETLRTTLNQLPGTLMLAAVAGHLLSKAFSSEKPDPQASPELFKKEMMDIQENLDILSNDLSGMVIKKADRYAYEFFLDSVRDTQKEVAKIAQKGKAGIQQLHDLKAVTLDYREGKKDFDPVSSCTETPLSTAFHSDRTAPPEQISYGKHTDRLMTAPSAPPLIRHR